MELHLVTDRDDVTAIKDVIEAETEAYLARDYDRWAACFVHAPHTCDVSMVPDRGVLVHRGWQAVSKAMRRNMDDFPKPKPNTHIHGDIEVVIGGNMARAVFESSCRAVENDVYPLHDMFQLRILERHGGRWRISCLSFATIRNAKSARPVIQVDENARVIWTSNRTLEALRGFEGLTISNGILRATDAKFGKLLRRTIVRAAEMRYVFDAPYFDEPNDIFVYPCLLGERQDGGTLHCTVFVRDGMVNVSFNDQDLIEGKIRASAEIFGLSAGQRTLVLSLAKGMSLPEAAAGMGISVNTGRTHLSRVYAKTGVNSQPALIRLLLSVSALPY